MKSVKFFFIMCRHSSRPLSNFGANETAWLNSTNSQAAEPIQGENGCQTQLHPPIHAGTLGSCNVF